MCIRMYVYIYTCSYKRYIQLIFLFGFGERRARGIRSSSRNVTKVSGIVFARDALRRERVHVLKGRRTRSGEP